MSTIKAVFKAMRPPFLVLTPVCIFLGLSLAYQLHGEVSVFLGCLAFIGALSAHISVNTFNEYFDYRSGLDELTTRTPFSGGSGALPATPGAVHAVGFTALATLAITLAIGVYLVSIKGALLLLLGVVGVLLIVLYTQWMNRFPWLCLFAPGLAFGPLFVLGTYLSVSPSQSVSHLSLASVFLVSLVPFFLINNLLLLNQIPDVTADQQVGRRTFPIHYGLSATGRIYLLFLLFAALPVPLAVSFGILSPLALLSLVPLSFGFPVFKGVFQSSPENNQLAHYLGVNVGLTLLCPLLLAVLSGALF